jgi:hypothetical protein
LAAPSRADRGFYRALVPRGRGRARLVELEDGEELRLAALSDAQAVAVPLRLTAEGERVLRGESDRVDALGIDRWVGGTHVTTSSLWRWDPAERRLVAPTSA